MTATRLSSLLVLVVLGGSLGACTATGGGEGDVAFKLPDGAVKSDIPWGGVTDVGPIPSTPGGNTSNLPGAAADGGTGSDVLVPVGPELCSNGKDDDGDGLADCSDTDCDTHPICAHNKTETLCGDGKDDDGDSYIDCADNDCKKTPACGAAGPEVCDNGTDDDGDKFIDCSDKDCQGASACQAKFEVCDNKLDDDSDGKVDCKDSDCASAPVCKPSGVEVCTNGIDDDGDGFIDCQDADCKAAPSCVAGVEQCTNKVDDDGDGLIDCKDFDCNKHAACAAPKVEKCQNGLDDDGDKLVDCDDDDCATAAACQPAPAVELCGNGKDDDGDKLVDCDDLDCDTDLACGGTGGVSGSCCTVNATVGCDDATVEACVCAGDDYCCTFSWDEYCVAAADGCGATCGGPAVENCTNGGDDDGDGAADCADSDCAAEETCQPVEGACCVAVSTNGCPANAAVQACVCDLDAYCCNTKWDGLCVTEAKGCGAKCAVAVEDCENGQDDDDDLAVDCKDPDCTSAAACQVPEEVCGNLKDDDGDGNADCSDTDCAATGGCAGPGSPCCLAGQSSGCGTDAALEACVCASDSFCCTNTWDNMCASAAKVCGANCNPPAEVCDNAADDDGDGSTDCADTDCATAPSCAASVCCESMTTPGCADPAIEACVCAKDSFCCATAWDYICVGEASSCGGQCNAGPMESICDDATDDDGDGKIDCGDSDCYYDPICVDVPIGACCTADIFVAGCPESPVVEGCVCATDAFCCDYGWDSQCVEEAQSCGSICI